MKRIIIAIVSASFFLISRVVAAQPKAVDLGLSVKWASCNVGATSPEEYGGYYAWGETSSKSEYSWETYIWSDGYVNSRPFLTKYVADASYGVPSFEEDWFLFAGEIVEGLFFKDDIARVKLGGKWRMPTDAEWTELREKCTWTWTKKNGVTGYLVKSKANNNAIFLPAAGHRDNTDLKYAVSHGFYWSSSLYTKYPTDAWYLYFNSDKVERNNSSRSDGLSVRPVTE